MSPPRIPKLQLLGRMEGPHAAKVQQKALAKRKPPPLPTLSPRARLAEASSVAAGMEPSIDQVFPKAAAPMLIEGLNRHQQRLAHKPHALIKRQGISPALVRKPRSIGGVLDYSKLMGRPAPKRR